MVSFLILIIVTLTFFFSIRDSYLTCSFSFVSFCCLFSFFFFLIVEDGCQVGGGHRRPSQYKESSSSISIINMITIGHYQRTQKQLVSTIYSMQVAPNRGPSSSQTGEQNNTTTEEKNSTKKIQKKRRRKRKEKKSTRKEKNGKKKMKENKIKIKGPRGYLIDEGWPIWQFYFVVFFFWSQTHI